MIISHQDRFVFIHNPKCAGSSFRHQIAHLHDDATTFWDIHFNHHLGLHLDHAHLRVWELRAFHGDLLERLRGYRSVVFVRNPIRRLASAIVHHIGAYRPELQFADCDRRDQIAIVDRIIDELTIERIITDYRYVHFSPQRWFFMHPDDTLAWKVLPLSNDAESILPGFDALGLPRAAPEPINTAPIDYSHLLNHPRLLLFGVDFYAGDFEAFHRLDLPTSLTTLP